MPSEGYQPPWGASNAPNGHHHGYQHHADWNHSSYAHMGGKGGASPHHAPHHHSHHMSHHMPHPPAHNAHFSHGYPLPTLPPPDTLGHAHAVSGPPLSSPNTRIMPGPSSFHPDSANANASAKTNPKHDPQVVSRENEAAMLFARFHTCVQERDMDGAAQVFEQIVKSHADANCAPGMSQQIPDLYLSFAKASLGKKTIITPLDLIHSLRRSRKPDKDFYESLMRILAHRQYFEFAIRVFEEMDKDNIKAEPVTFSCLVNFAVEMNDGVRAKIFFDALCKRQTPSIRAYMQMLRMQSKLKDAEEAFRLLKDMEARGVGVDRLAINTALGACVNGNDLDKARQLMTFAKRYHGDRLDIITFNTLMKGYAISGRVEEAFDLLEDMPQFQVQPNEITMNTLMDAAVRSNQYERAWNTLDTMRASGMTPDKYTWSTLAKGLKRSRDKERRRACHGLLQMIYEMKPQCALAVQQMNLYEFVWTVYSQSSNAVQSGKGAGKGAWGIRTPGGPETQGRSRSRSPRGAKGRSASSSSDSSDSSASSVEKPSQKRRSASSHNPAPTKSDAHVPRSNFADVAMSPARQLGS